MRLNLTIAIILLIACGRIRKEGHVLVDKLAPKYDPHTADTKNNKQRFKEFFKFDPGPDVTGLYCYNDDLLMAANYYFTFTCQESTRQKIVDTFTLLPDTRNMSFGGGLFSSPFPWWDTATIEKITPYSNTDSAQHIHRYLWYDPSTRRAFFFSFAP